MTSTTALSTSETNAWIDSMPPEHAALVRKACDTYDKAYAKAQRMRAARTAKLEALVLDAIQAKRARLERESRCAWTAILLEHFARRGVQAPDEEVVRRVVKSFPGF